MRIALILIAALSVTGCLSTFQQPSDEFSHTHNGIWIATLELGPEHQRMGGQSFICPSKGWDTMLFIEYGHVGHPAAGPFIGHVDPSGKLLAKFPVGGYSSHESLNQSADLIMDGTLSNIAGQGKVMHAIKGSEIGCRGYVTYQRTDPNSWTFDMEKQVTFSRGGYRTKSAVLKSAPIAPNEESAFIIELPLSRDCYGSWTKKPDNPSTGMWSAYCGSQVTVSGTWQLNDGRFEARGIDSYGNETLMTGQL